MTGAGAGDVTAGRRCTVGAHHEGRDSSRLAVYGGGCTCRSIIACWFCGEAHVFLARCRACADAGRPGVPFGEAREADRSWRERRR